jgi:hypothetical protein
MKQPALSQRTALLDFLAVAIPVLCLAIVIVVFGISFIPGPRQQELEEAFERYLEVLHDAYATLDTSHLPEVAVDHRLASAIFDVEARREFTAIASEEFSVGHVRVLSYGDTEASAKIQWNYRPFSQDFETGERTYGPTERWYWRDVRVVFVREDGVWKVQAIYFLDWSG